MNIGEIITRVKELYEGSVKPKVIGYPFVAGMEMGNISFMLREEMGEINKYPLGPAFAAAAKVLEKRLMNGKGAEHAISLFESYFSRLSSAVKSGNTY